jgi:hypothetical protein
MRQFLTPKMQRRIGVLWIGCVILRAAVAAFAPQITLFDANSIETIA